MRDYNTLAAVFQKRNAHIDATRDAHMRGTARVALLGLATDLASVFEADNPNFDRSRFLLACQGDCDGAKTKADRVTAAVNAAAPQNERTNR